MILKVRVFIGVYFDRNRSVLKFRILFGLLELIVASGTDPALFFLYNFHSIQ